MGDFVILVREKNRCLCSPPPPPLPPVLPYALFCQHSCKAVSDLSSSIRKSCGASFDHASFVNKIEK